MTDSNESLADADGAEGAGDELATEELPADVVDEAERLTRIARETPDENEAQARREWRASLLENYDFTARVREDDDAVLVLHPEEWHDAEAGVIRTERIDDLSRAIEVPLEGASDPDDWEAIDAHNRDIVARVRDRHGDVDGDNAEALADFVGNHYAKRIEDLTGAELREFVTDYFVRNAWPSEKQRDVIEESITRIYETVDEPVPEFRDR